ncbi:MAG: sulfatase family protein [Thermoguttaceae bacterium]
MQRLASSRRAWYGMVFVVLGLGAAAVQRPAQAEPNRPNIVFLLTDDQRWDTLGSVGNTIIQTPNLDRLARQGVLFRNMFVTTSICMTNRACILTGQYAARHGIWDFQASLTPAQLQQTYVGVLKRAGYYIGFIGKWGVGEPPRQMFDYDKTFPGQGRYEQKVAGQVVHLTKIMGDQAIEFLEQVPADRPFCLSVSFKAPHVQDGDPRQFIYEADLKDLYRGVAIPPPALADPALFEALPEFLRTSENRLRWKIRFATPEMYQESVRSYYRLISGVDRVVGRIAARLGERGLAERTVILFTSDNGFYLGERGFAGKWHPHEVSIRVPLVVFDPRPGGAQRGTRRDEMALSIDLAPTILEMAGLEVPAAMQGRSLVPLLRGEQPPWRSEFYYEHLFQHPRIPRSEAVRDQQYKYIRFVDSEPLYEELYDLAADPDEARNLAGQPEHRQTLLKMQEKWASWRKRVK